MIPDVTLTTACFNLQKYHNKTRDIDDIIKQIEPVCSMLCYIVFYGDIETISIIRKLREKYNILHLSFFIEMNYEDIESYKMIDKVKSNREKYWPSRDIRTCSETHLLQCNKFNFVLSTINSDPFKTSKFGWIDSFVGINGSKICENFDQFKILHVLNNISNKFHIQILNVNDKKYKLEENKREYYNQYRYVVCGCLFTCSKDIGIPILNRLNDIFIKTTELGYGHAEEMFFLEVFDEFYDDIERSYGDYGQILNNFIKPTRNIEYIVNFILKRYINFGYHKEAFDVSSKLMLQIESFEVYVKWNVYLDIIFNYYVASYYYKREISKEIVEKIRVLYNDIPDFKNAYNQNKMFYDQQLSYV